jgi:hypothetical protein
MNDAIAAEERKVAAAQRSTSLSQQSYDVAIAQAKAERALAQAKGDTATAGQVSLRIIDLEIAQAASLVTSKQKELETVKASAKLKIEDINQSSKSAEQKKQEIQAINDGVSAKQNEVAMAKSGAQTKSAALAQEKQAAEGAAQATSELGKRTLDATSIAGDFASLWNGLTTELRGMSPATVNKFFEGMGLSMREAGEGARVTAEQINQLKSSITESQMSVASNDWADLFRDMAVASEQAKVAFLEQKQSVDGAAESITRKLGDANVTVADLARYANASADGFDMLDKSDLSQLEGAINAAKSKLASLQQQALSAREAITGMADSLEEEVARSRGEYEKLAELQYQKKRAELEEKLAEARAGGDTKADAEYARALNLLNQKRAIDRAAAREQEAEYQKRGGSSGQSFGGIGGGTAGGTTGSITPAAAPPSTSTKTAAPTSTVRIQLKDGQGRTTELSAGERSQVEGLIRTLEGAGMTARRG